MSAVQISTGQSGTEHFGADPGNAVPQISWAEANQACLVMEFARLRQRLQTTGPRAMDESGSAQLDLSLQQLRESLDPPSAIDQLSAIFGLSPFEREIVLLAAGIEMDSTLASQCNEALGREQRQGSSSGSSGSITFSLALATLDDPHWSAAAPSAPLRRYHLVELESGHGLTSAPLRINERILHYLAGVNQLDARLEALLQTRRHPYWIAEEHHALAMEAGDTMDVSSPEAPVLLLCGDDPRGQEDVAALIADQAGRQLLILPVENVANIAGASSTAGLADSGVSETAQFAALWTREAALLPALLLVQCGASGLTVQARQMIERLPAPLIVASRDSVRLERRSLRYLVNKPQPASQKQLWTNALESHGPLAAGMDGLLDDLAEQFRLSAETIATVGYAAQPSGKPSADADKLWSTCRSLSRPRLEDLAERILPAAGGTISFCRNRRSRPFASSPPRHVFA
jgi:hypothetical protein